MELKVLPDPFSIMKQVGGDLCGLAESDKYFYVFAPIDYSSNWSEGKPIRLKSAITATQFLDEFICHHVCLRCYTRYKVYLESNHLLYFVLLCNLFFISTFI